MTHIAATLDYILRLDLESSRVVDLLEVAREVALMVVFPFNQAANLVSKLRVRDVAARLVHGALVASLERRGLVVVPEATSLVACLVLDLASHDVQDEGVARDFLVRFNLNYVTGLDAAPVGDLEALVALGEDEFLEGLAVDFLSRLLQFLVVEEVEAACGDDGGDSDENDMRVVGCLTLARDGLRAEMDE